MAFEITGKLIEKFETQIISDKFKKREFVVEFRDNPGMNYTEMIKFQLSNDRCTLIDAYQIGQEIRVAFNLKGRRWEKNGVANYITNLEAWKIEKVAASTPVANNPLPGNDDQPDLPVDDSGGLPF